MYLYNDKTFVKEVASVEEATSFIRKYAREVGFEVFYIRVIEKDGGNHYTFDYGSYSNFFHLYKTERE